MIELLFKDDGVWIHAKAEESSKEGLLSLNNIVNEMHPGIIRDAFVAAVIEALPNRETLPHE